SIWESAKKGDFNPNIESLFDRIVMKATFQDHLDLLNSHIDSDYLSTEEDLNEIVFNPSKELNLQEAVRLIVYDSNLSKYIIDEVIFVEETYKLEKSIYDNLASLKYKYQIKSNIKWKDITKYQKLSL